MIRTGERVLAFNANRELAAEKSEFVMRITELLERNEVRVETSTIVKGVSGVAHTFDLVAMKGGSWIPIDIRLALKGSVELGEVVETYVKSLDTKAKPAIVVAVPNASPDARTSAAAFGIALVEGSGMEEVLARLGAVLDRFLA